MRKAPCPMVPHLLAATAAASVLFAGSLANAQSTIKNPGDHNKYSVELEPHGLVQYGWTPDWVGTGWGLGFRASIPFLDNGPISTINNNMAITFGLDWAHFHEDWWCWGGPRWYNGYPWNASYGCSANSLWFPVALQWNFFLTDIISVFGEPGIALVHDWWNGWWPCNLPGAPNGLCKVTQSNTGVAPVFWAGARFMFSKNVGVAVRVGFPSSSVGLALQF